MTNETKIDLNVRHQPQRIRPGSPANIATSGCSFIAIALALVIAALGLFYAPSASAQTCDPANEICEPTVLETTPAIRNNITYSCSLYIPYITAPPIEDCSYDGAFKAVDAACKQHYGSTTWADIRLHELSTYQDWWMFACRADANTWMWEGSASAPSIDGSFAIHFQPSCPSGDNWTLDNQTPVCTRRCRDGTTIAQLANGAPVCKRPFPTVVGSCQVDGTLSGNPIFPAAQEKLRDELDWSDAGPAALRFERFYRSNPTASPLAGLQNMGPGWSHNHRWALTYLVGDATTEAPSVASIASPDGAESVFTQPVGTGIWSPTNSADALTQTDDGAWQYTRSDIDATLTFSADGLLQMRTERGGFIYTYAYDNSGLLSSVSNPFGRTLAFGYDDAERLVSVTLPDARALGYAYDASGRLASVTYPDGNSRSFLYENALFPQALTGIVDEGGLRWGTFAYDNQGRAISTELAGGVSRYQTSYASANRASVRDPLGTTRDYSYASKAGKLAIISSNLPSGEGQPDAASRQQDAHGLIISETDFKGSITQTTWDSTRHLPTRVTEGAGSAQERTTTTQWHATMALPTLVSEPGRNTAYTWDAQGLLLSKRVTDTLSTPNTTQTWNWTYTPQGLVSSEQAPNLATTSYTYDSRGNLLTATDALGHVSHYSWDSANRLLSHIAPSGLTTSYSWDARDRLLTQTVGADTAQAQTTQLSYNPTGTLATLALPNGLSIQYSYDTAHRLVGWSYNRGDGGTYELDDMGNTVNTNITDKNGTVAYVNARTINRINRVSASSEGANGSSPLVSERYTYDANGEQTSTANGLDQSTSYGLDSLRRIQSITNALANTASLTYNQLDAVTTAQDFAGVATNYLRDALGNATQETSPDVGMAHSAYDANGLLASTTDATGRTIGLERDALGRLTQLNYNDGTSSVLRYDLAGAAYNAAGSPNASIGQLSEVQDPGVTTQYQRDALGRVLRKTQTLAGGSTQSIAYSYVPAGQGGAGSVQSITYPSGKQLSYQYDSTGLVTGMQWNGSPLLANLQWSALGMPTSWSWPGVLSAAGSSSALAEARNYNTAGKLTHTAILDLSWDAAGRVTAVEQSQMVPGSAAGQPAQNARIASAYSYDAAGRITASGHNLKASPAITWPAGTGLLDVAGYNAMGYAYDANGNRASATIVKTPASGATSTSTTTTQTYSIATGTNRLVGVSSATGAATTSSNYSYDASGSLTTAIGSAEHYLHYGPNGRIASITTTASSADPSAVSYLYNSASQRVLKTDARHSSTAPRLEHALYSEDDAAQLLGTYSNQRSASSAAPAGELDSTEVLYLPTAQGLLPVAAQINGRLYAIHADHLNTPRRLTNAQGQVAWQWLLSGFGEVNPTTGANGYVQQESAAAGSLASYAPEVSFNLRYPGQQWDEETGLAFNIHRYYHPQEGRYIQADPIGLDGGWNRFSYVGGNPLNGIDPYGLQMVIPPGALGPPPVVPGSPPSGAQPIDPTEPWGPTYPPNSIQWPTLITPVVAPIIGPLVRPMINGFIDWCIESRGSDKERATDTPSFAKGKARLPNENCGQYAARVLEEHYGASHPKTLQRGPGSEFSKIKKNCERGGL